MSAQSLSSKQRPPRRPFAYWMQFSLAHLVLLVVMIFSLYPVFMMVINSFKHDSEIERNSSGLPIEWTLDSYTSAFSLAGESTSGGTGLWRNFINSVIVAVISTLAAVLVVSMAAFAFAKYKFKGRNFLFAMLIATMMVPFEITIPPLHLIFSRLHWLNTYQGLIVPTIASAFGLFMVRQYMLTVPSALLDSGRMDGASHWQLYWHIMIPTSAPILGAFAIIHFLGVWNSYLWPLVVATDRSMQPIMVVLPTLVDPVVGFRPVWGTIMAGGVLATLPIVIVFIMFQDKFMSSVTVGAIKE